MLRALDEEMEARSTVALGYLDAAASYRKQKDASLLDVLLVQMWVKQLKEVEGSDGGGAVVDLGCASGYPLAEHLAGQLALDYHGVDLCEHQIQLAEREHPHMKQRFHHAEMLEFMQKAASSSLGGVCALYSVVHVPRVLHARLFAAIFRALQPGAPLLLTVGAHAVESYDDDWLGVRMYWSQFSPMWYEITLGELGFDLVAKQFDEKKCLAESEAVWFMLLRKPDTSHDMHDAIPCE